MTEHGIIGGQPSDPTLLPTYLEMHGSVGAVRVTYYPGIGLPHIEVWSERPGAETCDPDAAVAYSYFSAFAPVRQDQTDAGWLELLASGQSTMLAPVEPTAPTKENP